MIYRCFEAGKYNDIVNNPLVHKWVAMPGQDTLDHTELLSDHNNVVLLMENNNHGGLLFHQLAPGLWEVHTNFYPGAAKTIDIQSVICECADWMFYNTNCTEIVTKVPENNTLAKKLAEGFMSFIFARDSAWTYYSGEVDKVNYYRLTIDSWVSRNSSGLMDLGEEFHKELETQLGHLDHEDDKTHDLWVGACVRMIEGGQALKGVILYNRWAVVAGYEQISIVSQSPLILDIKTALLVIHGDFTFTAVEM